MTALAPEPETAELPLFPLHTVLLPGAPLQLQVFEPRYLDMVGRCMRAGTGFGVVRILQGAEAGKVSDMAHTGTSARITDFHPLANGLLGLSCLGERVFDVLDRRSESDGLVVAQVSWRPLPAPVSVPPEHRNLVTLLRELLPQLPSAYARIPLHFEDAHWVGLRLLEILPLGAAQRQESLEQHDPIERLRWLAALLPAE